MSTTRSDNKTAREQAQKVAGEANFQHGQYLGTNYWALETLEADLA